MEKKWCLIDTCKCDEYLFAYDSKEKALKEAGNYYDTLTQSEKKNRVSFLVALCNVEEYKPGQWCFAELDNGNIDSRHYETAKTWVKNGNELL